MNCIICLETLDSGRLTPCCQKILFHEECGKGWNDTCFLNPRCPWCRDHSKFEQHYNNNVVSRSFDTLRKAMNEVHYKQTTYNYYSALDELNDEDLQDADGYFYITCMTDVEEGKNIFKVVFKNKTVFHFWSTLGILVKHYTSFSLENYRFLLENPSCSSRYYDKKHGIISEAYVTN